MLCSGSNYSDHNAEKANTPISGKEPEFFVKTADCVVGPDEPIVYDPLLSKKIDCEVELAIVIGKPGRHIAAAQALDHVFGYTIVNDVTARDVGRTEREGGNLFLAKSYDTFSPMGPWMVTRDAIPEPMHLRIQTRVNGESRQDGNTNDMIWSIPRLIAYLSQITLMPGDIITTGSPGGGGLANPEWYLRTGDVIDSEIEGIGVLRNAVVDAPAA
jgi:2-keto-4-pentenoate hydratase/2-oxohepta-3-ene-1,7-dioic acid hydratase in catechol pathway